MALRHNLAVVVFLGDEGLFHGLARVHFNVVGIDVDGVTGRDVAQGDQALAQGGLEVESILHADVLEEPVLGGRQRQKRKASEEAEVGSADRIDGADAGGVAEDGLENEAQCEALLRQTFGLGRSQTGGEVIGTKLQKVGNKEEPASAGRGQPAFQESGDVMLDVVASDDAWAWLAGAIEDFDLLFGEKPLRKRYWCHPFFLPGHSQPAPVRPVSR